ncbi:MAG: hypothetical protein FWC23_01740 [Chitinispirillia bacterium]|nr:hypothetical protein [Chitinispirillia bacterium]MCL2267899.1 hypothetical protein [Chitinispirillia bacterium]
MAAMKKRAVRKKPAAAKKEMAAKNKNAGKKTLSPQRALKVVNNDVYNEGYADGWTKAMQTCENMFHGVLNTLIATKETTKIPGKKIVKKRR